MSEGTLRYNEVMANKYNADTKSCDKVGLHEEVIFIHSAMHLWNESLAQCAHTHTQVCLDQGFAVGVAFR
jgi:hypothetical protein